MTAPAADDAIIYDQLAGELLTDPERVSAEISDGLAAWEAWLRGLLLLAGDSADVTDTVDAVLTPGTTEIPVVTADMTATTEIPAVTAEIPTDQPGPTGMEPTSTTT